VEFGFDPLFFSYNEHVARTITTFDAGSGIRGLSSGLLWGDASLFFSASELQS